MKHTLSAVFLVFSLFISNASSKTFFFLQDDSLYTLDTYDSEKIVQGKKVTVTHQISTSIVDFSKDDYTEISPFLIKTGAFKKIMSIKVLKYSIFESFSINEKKFLEQTTGYFLIDSTQISPIRQITVRSDNISNEYYDFSVKEETPTLRYKNYLNHYSEEKLKFKELYTHEQLFWLIRFMSEMNIENKKIYLLPPMVNGLFSEKVYFAEIQFEKEYFRIQGVNTQRVTVTREDDKKAEYWLSLESSKRIYKAHDFLGGWYSLRKSTIEHLQNWPF